MLRLRLFREGDLSHQLDSRSLDDGSVRIGRDAKADWAVPGASRDISREHLVVTSRGGLVTLRDTSSNGTFIGEPRQRIESGRDIPIAPGDVISFGPYVLVLEQTTESDPPVGAGTPRTGVPATSPFDAPSGQAVSPVAPRRPQPFASELPADPLSAVSPVNDHHDAWQRRPANEAGSWDASSAKRRREPTELIGSERNWRDPVPEPTDGAGLGFDAPFSRPILEKPAIGAQAAAIPSDWLDGGDKPAVPDVLPPEPLPPLQPLLPPEPLLSEPLPPIPEATAPPATGMDEPALGTSPAVAPATPVASDAVPPPSVAAVDDGALFDHFCAGAGLSPGSFAGENRVKMMEQLGAIYRQAVLGIADLMQERTSVRNEYRMLRTSVRPDGNNPFKWVPPQRIASELLRPEGDGYTTGARALNDALFDIKSHILCMLAGMREAVAATFEQLSPQAVERRLQNRTFMMRSQHDAAAWAEFVELARQLRVDTDESVDGAINRAFREGYEAQLHALGGGERA